MADDVDSLDSRNADVRANSRGRGGLYAVNSRGGLFQNQHRPTQAPNEVETAQIQQQLAAGRGGGGPPAQQSQQFLGVPSQSAQAQLQQPKSQERQQIQDMLQQQQQEQQQLLLQQQQKEQQLLQQQQQGEVTLNIQHEQQRQLQQQQQQEQQQILQRQQQQQQQLMQQQQQQQQQHGVTPAQQQQQQQQLQQQQQQQQSQLQHHQQQQRQQLAKYHEQGLTPLQQLQYMQKRQQHQLQQIQQQQQKLKQEQQKNDAAPQSPQQQRARQQQQQQLLLLEVQQKQLQQQLRQQQLFEEEEQHRERQRKQQQQQLEQERQEQNKQQQQQGQQSIGAPAPKRGGGPPVLSSSKQQQQQQQQAARPTEFSSSPKFVPKPKPAPKKQPPTGARRETMVLPAGGPEKLPNPSATVSGLDYGAEGEPPKDITLSSTTDPELRLSTTVEDAVRFLTTKRHFRIAVSKITNLPMDVPSVRIICKLIKPHNQSFVVSREMEPKVFYQLAQPPVDQPFAAFFECDFSIECTPSNLMLVEIECIDSQDKQRWIMGHVIQSLFHTVANFELPVIKGTPHVRDDYTTFAPLMRLMIRVNPKSGMMKSFLQMHPFGRGEIEMLADRKKKQGQIAQARMETYLAVEAFESQSTGDPPKIFTFAHMAPYSITRGFALCPHAIEGLNVGVNTPGMYFVVATSPDFDEVVQVSRGLDWNAPINQPRYIKSMMRFPSSFFDTYAVVILHVCRVVVTGGPNFEGVPPIPFDGSTVETLAWGIYNCFEYPKAVKFALNGGIPLYLGSPPEKLVLDCGEKLARDVCNEWLATPDSGLTPVKNGVIRASIGDPARFEELTLPPRDIFWERKRDEEAGGGRESGVPSLGAVLKHMGYDNPTVCASVSHSAIREVFLTRMRQKKEEQRQAVVSYS